MGSGQIVDILKMYEPKFEQKHGEKRWWDGSRLWDRYHMRWHGRLWDRIIDYHLKILSINRRASHHSRGWGWDGRCVGWWDISRFGWWWGGRWDKYSIFTIHISHLIYFSFFQ